MILPYASNFTHYLLELYMCALSNLRECRRGKDKDMQDEAWSSQHGLLLFYQLKNFPEKLSNYD
jgi:hypothetical protein